MDNMDVNELRAKYQEFQAQPDEPFQVGQIVRWKEGLRNKRAPRYGQPAVVVEILTKPERDKTKDSGSAYFNEPLDIVLGFLDEDGDFVTYHFDSRRFEVIESNDSTH